VKKDKSQGRGTLLLKKGGRGVEGRVSKKEHGTSSWHNVRKDMRNDRQKQSLVRRLEQKSKKTTKEKREKQL